ncbi:MAG: HAD family hydrolase [Deltaproteobacteria bacterium]|nr:HAD family hydrolase [Deltaproteobacteria bacterium]
MNKMFPRGILFDLDDTIIAYSANSKTIWKQVCEEFSAENDRLEPESLYLKIREVSNWYWDDPERHRTGRSDLNRARRVILEMVFNKLGVDDIPLAYKIGETFQKRKEEGLFLFEGAIETLEYLVENNVALAMMTNGETVKQREKIARFGLERYFRVILIEGEQGFGKPDDRVFKKAIEALDLGPGDCWAVGDNLEWDVEGPQRMGIFGIWNDFRKMGLPADSLVKPDRIINSIKELIEQAP